MPSEARKEGTCAQRVRATEMENYPSRTGVPELQRAWKNVDRHRWILVKAQYPHLGGTVIAGLDLPAPDSSTEPFPDGSALIRISDRLIAFLRGACRALLAGSDIVTPEGVAAKAPFAPPAVDKALMTVYRQWQALWDGAVLVPPEVPFAEQQEAIADALYCVALIFLVMHEYGHAALHGFRSDKPVPDREFEADGWALDALMETFGVVKQLPRLAMAGAAVYVRALAALEYLGQHERGRYPPSEQRLRGLLQRSMRWWVDEFDFYDKTSVFASNDWRLESAERALRGEPYLAPTRAERVVWMIMSGLIQMSEGEMQASRLLDELRTELRRASPEVISAAGAICSRVFSTAQPRYVAGDPYVHWIVDAFASELRTKLAAEFSTFLV